MHHFKWVPRPYLALLVCLCGLQAGRAQVPPPALLPFPVEPVFPLPL